MFRDLERVQTSFTGIAAHRDFGAAVAYAGTSEGGDAALVSGSYFSVLGLTPHLGRLLGPDDDRQPGSGQVVVLSYDYWQRRFGARSDVIGQPVRVNGQPMTIVGVAPQGFHGTTFGERPRIFVPISMREHVVPRWKGLDDRRSYWAYLFARLKPGVSEEQARTIFNGQYRSIHTTVDVPLAQGMSPSSFERFKNMEMQLEPGAQGQSRAPDEAGGPLTLLFGVTALVLLICCANVANLLLGRAAARATEMAVRLSIGAGRRHIVASAADRIDAPRDRGRRSPGSSSRDGPSAPCRRYSPATPTRSSSWHIDSEMVLFAAALSLATGVLFGLFPALHSTRPNLVTALKANAGQPSGARAAARFRLTLATAQIALSMALLISAGLFTKSLLNVARVDLGLKTEQLVVFGVSPAMNGYAVERVRQVLDGIQDELRAYPGVAGVTTSRVRLISGSASQSDFRLQGVAYGPEDNDGAYYNYVGTDYLRTLGIALVAGREFLPSDTEGTPKVAIVNEAFLRREKLGRDAIGKRLQRMGRSTGFDIEIVGVAANSAYDDVKQNEQAPLVLMPYRQDPDLAGANIYARTSGSEQDLMAALPRIVRNIDPASAGRRPADDDRAGARERGDGSVRHHVVGGVRRPRHASGGARSLRRARIYRDAADERVRPPDGARRRGKDGAASRPSSGRIDDGRGRSDRSGDRGGAGPRRRIAALSDERARPDSVCRRDNRIDRGSPVCGLDTSAPSRACRSNDRPALRVSLFTLGRLLRWRRLLWFWR